MGLYNRVAMVRVAACKQIMAAAKLSKLVDGGCSSVHRWWRGYCTTARNTLLAKARQ